MTNTNTNTETKPTATAEIEASLEEDVMAIHKKAVLRRHAAMGEWLCKNKAALYTIQTALMNAFMSYNEIHHDEEGLIGDIDDACDLLVQVIGSLRQAEYNKFQG